MRPWARRVWSVVAVLLFAALLVRTLVATLRKGWSGREQKGSCQNGYAILHSLLLMHEVG
jgi:hypothetical protein